MGEIVDILVNFDAYCNDCEHVEKMSTEEPCNECLSNPVNQHTDKPVMFREKS